MRTEIKSMRIGFRELAKERPAEAGLMSCRNAEVLGATEEFHHSGMIEPVAIIRHGEWGISGRG